MSNFIFSNLSLSDDVPLVSWPAGIAALHYSHVHHFPNREAYDDFYSIVEQLVNVGVPTFKDYAVKSLLSYLREHISDKAADWYEEYWTGPSEKYCLCDTGYAGSNNNMGMDVDWRDIKKQVPPSASLGTFLGAL